MVTSRVETRAKELVFVLEDEADVARIICGTLKQFDFETEHFSHGHEILRRITRKMPAICLVDLGLPDLDGLEVLRQLQESGTATIVLTGRGDVTDRVLGLELGADDYIVKPFAPRELVARISCVLRRLQKSTSIGSHNVAHFSGWTFDVDAHRLISPEGEHVSLSRAETQLLELFARAPNRVLTRAYILDVTGGAPTFDRTIDVRVSRLRQKLESDPQNPRILRTVYGSGYLFTSTVRWTKAH
ncbi:MAG: DNA-binding response regulator [Candidatus Rokuibacteriota bacterium]|nr:MAG: DNA-binding response regulator [Candidatus Rokubacteria bacterium]PYN29681.1 MAG: DNA-binding response regulator [Candidatus Rokubacteria bacterium]